MRRLKPRGEHAALLRLRPKANTLEAKKVTVVKKRIEYHVDKEQSPDGTSLLAPAAVAC